MNYALLLLVLALALRAQTISGKNATGNATLCPSGTFLQLSQDNTLTFFTDNSRDYDKVWLKPRSCRLPVRVKALKDAHFKLQTSNKYVFYEIVLGAYGNTRADIRSITDDHLNSTAVGVLRQDDYVPFVIAWNNSKIVVARGPNGSDIIVEWSNSSVNINVEMIGLAGYQLEFEGGDNYLEGYQLQEAEVSSYWVATPAQSAYKRFQRTLYGVDRMRFELTTAGVATIATIAFLASDDKNFSQPTYRLNIGADANTRTILYYRSHQLLFSNYTPGILSNSERRKFWVAWKDGRFTFGLGSEFYENSKLTSPDSTVVERFHSMAVDSTQQAQWDFIVEDYSCVAPCQVGWYSNKTTGGCRRCSMQLSNCFSCTETQSYDKLICTSCINGTLMLGEDGECLTECPPHIGYTPDYEQRKCLCSYGACCGPVAFRLCFMVIPCILGALLLVPVLLWVTRRLRRLHFNDPQRWRIFLWRP